MKFLPLTLILAFCISLSLHAQTEETRIWVPSTNGIIVIEPENAQGLVSSASAWEIRENYEGVEGAITWRGPGNTKGGSNIVPYDTDHPTDAILRFPVLVDNNRWWRLRVYNRHLKEDGDNDVWVSLDGLDWAKFHDHNESTWTWDESNFGTYNTLTMSRGRVQYVEIAGRSVGFTIDRLVLHQSRAEDSEWQDLTLEETTVTERLYQGQFYIWSGEEDLGEGWRYLEGFGYLNDLFHPWAYHTDLGWMYVIGTETSSVYFYHFDSNQWAWTGTSMLPLYYGFNEDEWYEIGGE